MLELKQQLSNEQTVHSILERALHPTATRSAAALSSIPAFIPSKAKELLAELVLVEEEIARLESQIVTMKQDRLLAQQERSSTMETAVQQEGRRPSSIATAATAPMPYTSNANGSGAPAPASVAPEIKSMFFISQAMNMNAEYLNRHLAADATKSPKDHHHTAASISPKFNTNIFNLPPRNSLDKQSNHRAAAADQKPSKPVQEHSPTSAKREEQSSSKIQPNKLSERIVKCLVCIFIRMLRSSRAVEMEKSGSLARSGKNTPQGSFRIDTGLNVAAGVAKEKDRRGQQDHYGIFAIQDSVVRDIGPYKNLVRFTSSSFDPRGFSSSPLLTKLRLVKFSKPVHPFIHWVSVQHRISENSPICAEFWRCCLYDREMLEALQQVDLRFLTHQQKLAFWLNIYNTCIMHVCTGILTNIFSAAVL